MENIISREEYLKSQSIVDKYNSQSDTRTAFKLNLPPYVRLGGTAMRYNVDSDQYYRDAGCWSVNYKIVDKKIISDCRYGLDYLSNIELMPITFEEYCAENVGYFNVDKKRYEEYEEKEDDLPY